MKKLVVSVLLGFFILWSASTQTWDKNYRSTWENYKKDDKSFSGVLYPALIAAMSDSAEDILRNVVNQQMSIGPDGTTLEQVCWMVSDYYIKNPDKGSNEFFPEFVKIITPSFTSKTNALKPFYSGTRLFNGWKEYKSNNYSYSTEPKTFEYGMYVSTSFAAYKSLWSSDFADSIELEQLYMIVGQYLEAHPNYWHKRASELVRLALEEAFPRK